MESYVEEIKKRIDLVELIGSFIQLKKAGRNFKAICPFHQEKTPSFVISPERQIWHCFGTCQTGGDVITFLMKWENITFFEAIKELADKTGVKIAVTDFEDQIWQKKEKLITINQLASQYYEYLLHNTKFGKKALDYLNNRKINLKIIKTFNLGYSLNSWDGLLRFLTKKKYKKQEIFEAGLLVRTEKASYYDRFRGRLIFPIKDARGNIIGFSGRSLDKENKEAKYINIPETPIYHKRETLFGINLAKEAIKKEGAAILVEGEFDVISPYQFGVENIVAIKGSALTREQLLLLKRFTQKIVLALDADLTGEEAMRRGIEEAENLEFEVYVLTFGFAKDPDEASHKDLIQFRENLKKPIPLYDFVINLAIKKNSSGDPFDKKRIAAEVIPFIGKIKNPIIRAHYVKKLADILAVDEESVHLLITKNKQKKKQYDHFKSTNTIGSGINREMMIQKYLLSILFQDKAIFELSEKIFTILQPEDFSFLSHQKIIKYFLQHMSHASEFSLELFSKSLPKELQTVFDEIYLFASVEQNFEDNSIERLAYEIKKDSLKKKLANLLESSENDRDDIKTKIAEYTLTLKEVEKTLITL